MFEWLRKLLRLDVNPGPKSSRTRLGTVAIKIGRRETNQPKSPRAITSEEIVPVFFVRLFNLPENSRKTALEAKEARWLEQRRADLDEDPERLTALVPRMPDTLPKLMAALSDNDLPVHRLTEMIEADPVIAANVLKLVNSPALRVRREDISSLDQAIMLLGFKGMREVIAAAMFSPVARLETQPGINPLLAREIWPLSLLAAAAVRQGLADDRHLFEETDGNLGFEVYLAALTRMTGLVALLRLRQGLNPPSLAFCHELVDLVPAFSAHLAVAWDLPPRTIELLNNRSKAPSLPEPAYRMLRDATDFATACTLTNRRYLDRGQLLHFCRALPPYARHWFDLCPQPQAGHGNK